MTDLYEQILAAPAGYKVRVYNNGTGVPGTQIVSVEPSIDCRSWAGPTSFGEVIASFFLALVVGGIFVVPILGFVAIFALQIFFGVEVGRSDASTALLVYGWLGLTVLCGLFYTWVVKYVL